MIAGLNTKANYYAFGMAIQGRKYQVSNRYRYDFNGKENDPETIGAGEGTQDYGFRIYNPSLGKFLSIDPLTKSYPELTPYQFASNRPIDGIDLDGLEFNKYITPQAIGQRLFELSLKPQGIQKGGGRTCVVAAINYLWVSNNASSYSAHSIELYASGKTKINNFVIEPQYQTEKMNPYTSGKNNSGRTDGSPSVDWMMITSIQNSLNKELNKLPYYGNSTVSPGNSEKEVAYLMTNLLGLKNVKQETNKSSVYGLLYAAQKRSEEGYQEIWGIDGTFLLNRFGNNIDWKPNHAVGLVPKSISIECRNGVMYYNFSVQSWGEQYDLKNVTAEEFRNMFYLTTYGKPEEKKP